MNDPNVKPGKDDLTDQTLGDFRLLRRLGKGGMAEVFLAEQRSLTRHVAVKVLLPENAASIDADDVLLKRFQLEAKAAAGLSHPNIVQVIAIGETDGLHYIVQEYVEGLNLAEYVKRNGPPDAKIATHLMLQVASALKVAADAGIVHRDIKPENIMLTRHGDAKVTDFGLAQLTQSPEKLNLTQAGTTMGTPLYMSPEQVNGKKLDHRTDIYSFGVTAYHMLAGRPPFIGETAMAVAVQHLKDDPPPLASKRADLPTGLTKTIHQMMAKDPADRQKDAGQLINELDKVAATLGTQTARFSLDPVQDGTRIGRFLKSDWVKSFGKVALLLGVVAGLAAINGRYHRPAVTPTPTDKIPQKPTADGQFMLASKEGNNVSAWEAVPDYFPETLPAKRALSRLAKLFLDREERREKSNRNYVNAIGQYEKMKRLGLAWEDDDLQARANVGLGYIAAMQNQIKEAREYIEVNLLDLPQLSESCIEYQLKEIAEAIIESSTLVEGDDGES